MTWVQRILIAIGVLATIGVVLVDVSAAFPWSISVTSVLIVGVLIVSKKPDNRLGRLLLWIGALGQFSFLLTSSTSLIADGATAAWVETVGGAMGTAWVPFLAFVLLIFPDGTPPPGRWRHLRWAVLLAVVLGFSAALLNGGWGGDITQGENVSPLRDATAPLGDILSGVFFPFFLLSFLGAAAALIARYRKSVGETRLQFKWLAYAAGFVFASIAVLLTTNGFADVATDELWESVLMSLAFAAIPAGIAVAVLKYRLYDVDVVINRTVVLSILAAFITTPYALIVVGIGRLVGGEEGLLLPIAGTAIVALAFEPMRDRAQAWANRFVYGQRATPYDVLSNMTERLSHGEDVGGLLDRLAHLLADGTGADRAVIWLGDEGSMTQGASWPEAVPGEGRDRSPGDLTFPVLHNEEVVGALEIVKPRGTALSTTERHLIDDLAGSIGAVLGHRKLNDSLAAKALELAESRSRLVDAQDAERRRLERDLHDGAQQLIVALKVKLGLARTLAERHEAAQLVTMLDGLVAEADAALDEVRALARGIYPPVLESDGLRAAVHGLADAFPRPIEVDIDGLDRYDPDVEAAVYFQISEAVTNAIKHTEGPVVVRLAEDGDALRFEVADRGPGFDVRSANGGSGLQNMKDRIAAVGGEVEIESEPKSGTVVRGWVPVSEMAVV